MEADLKNIDPTLYALAERFIAGLYLVKAGRFIFVNDNVSRYTEYPVKELVGAKADSLIHPDDKERVKIEARRMLRGESHVPYLFRIITKQGHIRWVMEMISPYTLDRTPMLLGSTMNVTDRNEAQERLQASENLYRTIFETTGTAMTIVEEDMTVSLVNTEFEKLSGAGKDFWEGNHSWKEYVHADDLGRMLRYHHDRRIDPGSAPRSYEFRIMDRQGGVHDVLNTISIIPGTKRSVSSYIDISGRKKYEDTLIRRETELRDKTRDLEELNAALRVLLKQRDEDRSELEDNVLSVLNRLVMPCIEKLKKSPLRESDMTCLHVIESHLKDITSSFVRKLSSEHLKLTPRELQMAGLIKEGRTTKEIADFMNISLATVEIHRHHIREKLGLTGQKTNLRTFLASLS